jgi:replicative DNA helicase
MNGSAELLYSPHVAHAVIAARMAGDSTSVSSFLQPEHFADHRDQIIWATLLELEAEGIGSNYTALVERLTRNSAHDEGDWPIYCALIQSALPLVSTFGMRACARAVYEKWKRWQVYQQAILLAGRALDLSVPLSDVTYWIENAL